MHFARRVVEINRKPLDESIQRLKQLGKDKLRFQAVEAR